MHYVYVLKSEKDGKHYIGYTNDLERRLRFHNDGKVTATKWRLPVRLVYYEACEAEIDSRNRERFFKTGWGRRYLKQRLAHAP